MKRKDREYLVGFPRDVFEENLSAERRRKKTSKTIEYSSMRRERNHANKCVNQLRESSLVSFALETGIQSADPRRLFRGHLSIPFSRDSFIVTSNRRHRTNEEASSPSSVRRAFTCRSMERIDFVLFLSAIVWSTCQRSVIATTCPISMLVHPFRRRPHVEQPIQQFHQDCYLHTQGKVDETNTDHRTLRM